MPDRFHVVFVVDPRHRPQGVVELHRVLTSRRPVKMADIVDPEVEVIPVDMDREEVAFLAPTSRHLEALETVVNELGHPAGNLFHDIHTAVLMREHGIPEIITADTDFLQFTFLRVLNPLH